jgi:MFS family permease
VNQVPSLLIVSVAQGLVNAFDMPTRQAFVVTLIEDKNDLANAIALNSFLVNAARVVGPALAGVMLSLSGEAACFGLNALSFVAVIVAIPLMHWPHLSPAAPSAGWWANWREGARYAFGFARRRC